MLFLIIFYSLFNIYIFFFNKCFLISYISTNILNLNAIKKLFILRGFFGHYLQFINVYFMLFLVF